MSTILPSLLCHPALDEETNQTEDQGTPSHIGIHLQVENPAIFPFGGLVNGLPGQKELCTVHD